MAIYTDDLESYGTGAGIPTGYTGRWNYAAGEWDRVTDTDVAVRHVEANIARTAVSMNAVDADANRANFDILVRFKATAGLGSDLRGGVVGRGSGSAGAESGYTCSINLTELRIGKYSGGSSTTTGTTTGLGLSSSATYYWMRFRGQGTSSPVALKAKIWTGEEVDEPGTWTLEVSDSTSPITANGWCGMFSFSDGTKHWRDIAVATNGDVATMTTGGTSPVTSDLAGSFSLRAALQADLAGSFSLRSAVAADLAGSLQLRGAVQQDLGGSFVVRAAISRDLAGSFDVAGAGGTTSVTSDLAGSFALRGQVLANLAGSMVVRGSVYRDLVGSFDVAGPAGATSVVSDLPGAFVVRASLVASLPGSFQILGDAPVLVTPSGRIWLIEADDRAIPVYQDDRVTLVYAD